MSNSKKKCDCGGEMTRMPHFSWCSINRVDSVSLSDDMDMKELDTSLAGINSTWSIPHQLSGNGVSISGGLNGITQSKLPIQINYGPSYYTSNNQLNASTTFTDRSGLTQVCTIDARVPGLPSVYKYRTVLTWTEYAADDLRLLVSEIFFHLSYELHKIDKFNVRPARADDPVNSEWILEVSWKS